MGRMLELTADDGFRLAAYEAVPDDRVHGGLVVVQEIFGVNSHIRSVCDGFAREGFVALAPALFDRAQRDVELGYGDEDVAKGRALKERAKLTDVLRDVAAARAALASAGKVGIVGYCWGGYVAWMAAARLPGFACAIPYYGGGMAEARNETPRCPALGHFGRQDAHIPVAGIEALAAEHPEVEVHFYDAGHGFNCDQRASYDPTAAALARSRTLAFLRRHLERS